MHKSEQADREKKFQRNESKYNKLSASTVHIVVMVLFFALMILNPDLIPAGRGCPKPVECS